MEAFNETIPHDWGYPVGDQPDYLDGRMVVAVDTETTGLDWFAGDFPFVATVSDYDRDYLYRLAEHPEHDHTGDWEMLAKLLREADVLIFHNAPFDVHVLVTAGLIDLDEILAKEIHDTNILARCVLGASNGPFGLKHLAATLLDSDAQAPEQRMDEAMVSLGLIRKVGQRDRPAGAYYQTWVHYPDAVEHYALKDTRYTYDLYHLLMERATDDDLVLYGLERSVQPTLIQMEHTGTMLDRDRVAEVRAQYEELQRNAAEQLLELNGYEEINLASNAEVADMLIRRGVPLRRTTDTGHIRVDKWALEDYKDDPAVDLLLTYRNASKFLSTYIEPMVGVGTVHTSFWQLGARTGRMSCSRPNLQNIPVRSGPEIREMFVPRPGYVFLDADYSSIELRILAYYMGDPAFWEIIESGDPFMWIGEQVYGTSDQSQWKVGRQALKNGTYALTYGAGGPKLASTIGGGMTPDEGRDLARRIKNALGPGYFQLNRRIKQKIEKDGFVRTLARRTQYVDPERSYVGLNALIQGTAADLMKEGLVRADEALAAIGAYPLLVIHDEILAECPAEHAEIGLEMLKDAMASATDKFNLKVDGKICRNSFGEGK